MTLTREEILAMEPGRQLNRLVQEHILKWIPWQEGRGDYTAIVYQNPGEREPYMRTQRWETAKERYSIIAYSDIDEMVHAVYGDKGWSTDISAAWEVEERILALYLNEQPGLIDDYIDSLMDVIRKEHGFSPAFRLAHATPEQRCKAALMAVLGL
ncbi:hypothetical protein [Paenibacillus donghaensis]|uniref:Uncharacterized protein n=1 Tax=Paenibacillus donghaensis TaxID=414771 RepID=A0A2Z2KP13_9BACL|nr:hypothetical protein [Paenibacillus donghaensis]ASA25403.1 hypothetical protein B9T62_34520 [Paenibacillus donghaensis]